MSIEKGDIVKHILDNEECGRMIVLHVEAYGGNEAFCRIVKNGSFVIELFRLDELKPSDSEDDQVTKLTKELEGMKESKESYERWYASEQKSTKELKEKLKLAEEAQQPKDSTFPDGM